MLKQEIYLRLKPQQRTEYLLHLYNKSNSNGGLIIGATIMILIAINSLSGSSAPKGVILFSGTYGVFLMIYSVIRPLLVERGLNRQFERIAMLNKIK